MEKYHKPEGHKAECCRAFISRARQQLGAECLSLVSRARCCPGGKPRNTEQPSHGTGKPGTGFVRPSGDVAYFFSTSFSSGYTAQERTTRQDPGAPEPRGEGNPGTGPPLDRSGPAGPGLATREPHHATEMLTSQSVPTPPPPHPPGPGGPPRRKHPRVKDP